jgi:TRAP-type mannitol/chloroaromatic compound transport system permease large subunit
MFLALTILLMAGFPVTFTLMGTAMCFGLIGFGWSFFNLLPLRIWGVMTNVTLIAVPLFVFMGVMLERSGLAEELLDTMGLLFGRLRGGLAISVVVVGALLGASTGIVGATVVTMGLLAVPTMLVAATRRSWPPVRFPLPAPWARLSHPASFWCSSATSSAFPSATCLWAPSFRACCWWGCLSFTS